MTKGTGVFMPRSAEDVATSALRGSGACASAYTSTPAGASAFWNCFIVSSPEMPGAQSQPSVNTTGGEGPTYGSTSGVTADPAPARTSMGSAAGHPVMRGAEARSFSFNSSRSGRYSGLSSGSQLPQRRVQSTSLPTLSRQSPVMTTHSSLSAGSSRASGANQQQLGLIPSAHISSWDELPAAATGRLSLSSDSRASLTLPAASGVLHMSADASLDASNAAAGAARYSFDSSTGLVQQYSRTLPGPSSSSGALQPGYGCQADLVVIPFCCGPPLLQHSLTPPQPVPQQLPASCVSQGSTLYPLQAQLAAPMAAGQTEGCTAAAWDINTYQLTTHPAAAGDVSFGVLIPTSNLVATSSGSSNTTTLLPERPLLLPSTATAGPMGLCLAPLSRGSVYTAADVPVSDSCFSGHQVVMGNTTEAAAVALAHDKLAQLEKVEALHLKLRQEFMTLLPFIRPAAGPAR